MKRPPFGAVFLLIAPSSEPRQRGGRTYQSPSPACLLSVCRAGLGVSRKMERRFPMNVSGMLIFLPLCASWRRHTRSSLWVTERGRVSCHRNFKPLVRRARPGGRARRYPHGPRMMPGYRGARASQSRRRVHEGSSPASCFGPPTLPLGARPTRRCLDIGRSYRRCGLDTHQNHNASSLRRIPPRSFVAESSCPGSAS